MLELTRGQIITQGLSKAGRPDLVTDARLWLNLFLEEMYFNQDFNWLVKTLGSIPAIDGYSLPSDYRAAKSILIDDNGNLREINVVTNAAEWDSLRRSLRNVFSSVPENIYIDHDLRQMFFLPQPKTPVSMEFKYYYMPVIPTHTIAANDLETVKWGLPTSILTDYIKTQAMEYNDDQRQFNNMKLIDKKVTEGKMNNHDRRGGRSTLPLGKSFKRRFGPSGKVR